MRHRKITTSIERSQSFRAIVEALKIRLLDTCAQRKRMVLHSEFVALSAGLVCHV